MQFKKRLQLSNDIYSSAALIIHANQEGFIIFGIEFDVNIFSF